MVGGAGVLRDLGQPVERLDDAFHFRFDRRPPGIVVLQRADRREKVLQAFSEIDVSLTNHPLDAGDVAHPVIGD